MSIKKLVVAGLIIGMLLGLAVTHYQANRCIDATDLRTAFFENKKRTEAFVNVGKFFEGRLLKISFEKCIWTESHLKSKKIEYALLMRDDIKINEKPVLWNIQMDFQKTSKPKEEDDNIKSITIRIQKGTLLCVEENPLDIRNSVIISLEGLTDHCIVEME